MTNVEIEDHPLAAYHRTKGTKESVEKARLVMKSAPTPCDDYKWEER